MQSNEKITQLNKKLPHGARKKIAYKAGLSLNTVARYFRGDAVSFDTEVLIIKEAKILINEIERLEREKQDVLNYID